MHPESCGPSAPGAAPCLERHAGDVTPGGARPAGLARRVRPDQPTPEGCRP